jgi:hypothetical protein
MPTTRKAKAAMAKMIITAISTVVKPSGVSLDG